MTEKRKPLEAMPAAELYPGGKGRNGSRLHPRQTCCTVRRQPPSAALRSYASRGRRGPPQPAGALASPNE